MQACRNVIMHIQYLHKYSFLNFQSDYKLFLAVIKILDDNNIVQYWIIMSIDSSLNTKRLALPGYKFKTCHIASL